MNDWIPFSDGEYLVEQALLLAGQDRAIFVEGVIVEVYSDRRGQQYLRGRGRVRNILMVELLEESDDLDLLLDFGEEFKFLLKVPNLQVGKVFSPQLQPDTKDPGEVTCHYICLFLETGSPAQSSF